MLDGAAYTALPPVDERLPRHPLVLGTEADMGAYGGVLRRPILQTTFGSAEPQQRSRALRLQGDAARRAVDSLNAHRLYAYDADLVLRPWLLESWEYDGQGVWTLHLREGLRWSDGASLTLQDFAFALEHTPRIDAPQLRDLLRQTYEVVDDFTLRVHSASLDALENLAGTIEQFTLLAPAHYIHPFLPEPDGAADAWGEWWQEHVDWRTNPALPSLNAWVLAGSPDADTVIYRRNPYSWQVDAAGNQLPYLDEVAFAWMDAAGAQRRLARYELDYADEGLTLADYAWLRDNLDATYGVHACPSPGHLALQLNLSIADPAKRALVNDRRVRRAVSLLIDRENLNLFHYEGLAKPRQLAPAGGGRYANEELAGSHISHSPEEANRLLDEAGYSARDDEGYRLLPDRERISWALLEVSAAQAPSPDAEMVAASLAQGGIECVARAVSGREFVMMWSSNAWDCLYGRVEIPVVPTALQFGMWAGQWPAVHWYGLFRADPQEPFVEPPADHFLWSLWALYEQYKAATTEEERVTIWQEAMAMWREELPAIGVLGEMPRLVVARRTLRGLNPTALYADEMGGLGGGRLALSHYAG